MIKNYSAHFSEWTYCFCSFPEFPEHFKHGEGDTGGVFLKDGGPSVFIAVLLLSGGRDSYLFKCVSQVGPAAIYAHARMAAPAE